MANGGLGAAAESASPPKPPPETSVLDGQGLGVSTSIRFGSPGIEIAACAHEMKADLVVIGHTGKGVLARLFEGSVGAELLNNLPCSLLVATGEA